MRVASWPEVAAGQGSTQEAWPDWVPWQGPQKGHRSFGSADGQSDISDNPRWIKGSDLEAGARSQLQVSMPR